MPVNKFVCFDVLRLTSTRLPTRWTLSGSAGLMQDWTSSASLRRGMKMLKTFRFVDCTLRVCSCWSVLVPFGLGRGPTTYPIKITAEWRWSHLPPSGLQSSMSHLSLSPSSIIARVTVAGSSFVFAVVYRPGSASATAAFFDEFRVLLEHLSSFATPYVISGDINLRFH